MILSRRSIFFFAGALVLTMITDRADTAEPPPGVTSCSGCHSTSAKVETPVPPISGRNEADIVAAMQGFRSGERPSTVMGRIAKGFDDDEIQAIAVWLATQQK
jgi:cytochrome c553